jgi:hypothetical protein
MCLPCACLLPPLLQWKRKAEQYLIASGLNYTIIHPGGEGMLPSGHVVDSSPALMCHTAVLHTQPWLAPRHKTLPLLPPLLSLR